MINGIFFVVFYKPASCFRGAAFLCVRLLAKHKTKWYNSEVRKEKIYELQRRIFKKTRTVAR